MTIGNNNGPNQAGQFAARLRVFIEGLLSLGPLRAILGIPDGVAWVAEMVRRYTVLAEWFAAHPTDIFTAFPIVARGMLSNRFPQEGDSNETLSRLYGDPSRFLADALSGVFTDRGLRETFEVIGSLIYDTSVASITGDTPPVNSDAAERARAFVGFVTALGAAPQALSAAAEVASLGQIDKIGDNIKNVYWNLGLGFLTWQVMAPILQASILEPLTRDVQSQWRGQRFTLAQNEDLFALGRITREQLTAELIQLGWRDQDIEQVVALAYTKLSRSDVIDLWQLGIFDDIETARRLRANGYSPDDVELIMRKETRKDVQDDRAESVSILTSSFEKGLISEVDFIALMQKQRYSLNEIELRIGLIRLKQDTTNKELSVGQLKQAWTNNVILDEEALHHLMELGYAESETATILATWKAQVAPKFLQVNQSNVLEAYRFGILDRRATLEQLTKIGYSIDAATTLVEITEAKYPEAFGGSAPRKQRLLSLGAITDLYAVGRVDEAGVLSWAKQSGFSDADGQNLLFLIKLQAQGSSRPLSQATIESAYATGVFTRDQALAALEQLGFTPADANTDLTVFEKKNAATFNPQDVTSVRQPSITVLVKAYQAGFIDQTEFYDRATAIGYTKEAAQIYLETANTKQVKGTKALTKAEIAEAYKKNMFDYSTARAELEDLGYSSENADLLLRLEQKGVTSTDVWTSLLQGWIDPESALTALIGLGFTVDEVNAAIDALNAAFG